MGKSTISMAIFNSYVKLSEGNYGYYGGYNYFLTTVLSLRQLAMAS